MPSRFDLATGKVPPGKIDKEIEDSIKIISEELIKEEETVDEEEEDGEYPVRAIPPPRRRHSRPTFLNRIKLVNEATGAEIQLTSSAEFNLTMSATHRGSEANISLTINCPIDEAQRFFEGLST